MDTNTYNRSLPLLAAALSDQRNIKVEIGGDKAFTDGRTIHLPSLPLDADEALHSVAAGFCDHECSHVLFTDFSAQNGTPLTPLEKFLANAIEDVRIEALMAERYPGCARNFRATAKHVFIDKAQPYDPAFTVPNYVLLRLRRQSCPELAGRAAQATLDVTQHFPDLLPKLALVFADIERSCPDTEASIRYGKRFAELLQGYEQERAEQEGAAESDDASPATNGIQIDEESNGESTPPTSMAPLFASDAADHLPKGIGETLSEELEANSENTRSDNAILTAVEVPDTFRPMPPGMLEQAIRLESSLRPALVGCLQADTYFGVMAATRGRLNTRKLFSAVFGQQHVFTKHVPARLASTSLTILVDRSGSTTRIADKVAISAYALAHAASSIRGVSCAMSVFPVLDPSSRNCDQPGVCTLIRHGQVSKQYKAFGAEGFTPLAEAIWRCLPALMRQRTSRRIMLVFSDGEPDSVPKAKMALRDAAALGVETYAVSYDSDAVKMLFPEHRCAVITNIDALPGVLTNMLRSALQRAA